MSPENVFLMLSKPIQKAIKERGFLKPTEPQTKAIPLILEGKNVLLIAPTATGKTEAALLPIFHKFLMSEKGPGIKILYITPLRALNRDLLERLEWWCRKLDVKVSVRHGDTEVRERALQAKSPPDMLITTPETLQAILVGFIMRRHLRSVRWVIVDEVHELAGDKRGSQLSLELERLRWVTRRDFQIVGLSATIGSPEKVAKFLVGTDRECEVVKVPVARHMRLKIFFPQPSGGDYDLASRLYTHPEVAARLQVMRELIEKHRSILLFTNTRAIAEVLASRFKVWDIDFPISIHHGSLSKPSRVSAEQGLKKGTLKSLVCTSSLELGIDVGRIDLCIQYNSPRQVTRLLQRIGRSGHRIGLVAKGAIITIDSDDTLEAMAIGRRAFLEDLEEVNIPEKPLDALNQQIAGLIMMRKRWYFYEILDLFRKAYPYRNLTEEDVERVIAYMHTRYPRLAWASFEDNVVLKSKNRKDIYEYYFENLSMIPDEKQYLVIDETSDTPIGVLDEVFVAEYGEPGTKFICRGSPWKVVHLYGDRLYVRPVSDPTGAIPDWVGEEIPVPFEVALEVGEIRRFVEESIEKGNGYDKIAAELAKQYPVDKETARRAIMETVEHIERGYAAPTDRRVVVEGWKDYIIIHGNFGSLVNRTLARLVGHAIAEKTGHTVGVQQDPYRVVIQTMGIVSPEEVGEILKELADMDIKDIAIKAAVKTGLFKRRLVHVAKKFGALPRRADLGTVSLRKLIKSFEDTVIHDEAVKDMLMTDLDVKNTVKVLKDIRDGKIEVVCFETEESTPLAAIGMERISRKTDLIPADKMKHILLESAKARLLSEVRTFACLNCWKFVRMIRIKDLPEKIVCPKCGSKNIGLFEVSDEDLKTLVKKGGKPTTAEERKMIELAEERARLISECGKAAAIALAGRRLRTWDAEDVLWMENKISDRLFELVLEAERKALKRRFW